jgi:hypothetical protein
MQNSFDFSVADEPARAKISHSLGTSVCRRAWLFDVPSQGFVLESVILGKIEKDRLGGHVAKRNLGWTLPRLQGQLKVDGAIQPVHLEDSPSPPVIAKFGQGL